MPELLISPRTAFGKKTRALRRSGFVPGEVYGHHAENRHVSVSARDLSRVFQETATHAIVTLIDAATKEKIPALIVDLHHDAVAQTVLAVDFRQVRMDEKIKAPIPVVFIGEAPAIKKGLTVLHVLSEVEIEALPAAIPDRFEVNLTTLEDVGQSIHVQDLAVPKGVRVLVPEDTVLVTVSERTKEEEVAPQPAAEATVTEPATTEPGAESKEHE